MKHVVLFAVNGWVIIVIISNHDMVKLGNIHSRLYCYQLTGRKTPSYLLGILNEAGVIAGNRWVIIVFISNPDMVKLGSTQQVLVLPEIVGEARVSAVNRWVIIISNPDTDGETREHTAGFSVRLLPEIVDEARVIAVNRWVIIISNPDTDGETREHTAGFSVTRDWWSPVNNHGHTFVWSRVSCQVGQLIGCQHHTL